VPGEKEDESSCSSPRFIDFADEEDVDFDEILRRQNEEFDFTGMMKQSKASIGSGKQTKSSTRGPVDLLGEDLEEDDTSKDDMTLLNEILGSGTGGGGKSTPGDFSQEWTSVFGGTGSGASLIHSGGQEGEVSSGNFMPSCLLDIGTEGGGAMGGLKRLPQGMAGALPPPLLTPTGRNPVLGPTTSQNTGPKPKKKV